MVPRPLRRGRPHARLRDRLRLPAEDRPLEDGLLHRPEGLPGPPELRPVAAHLPHLPRRAGRSDREAARRPSRLP